MRTKLGREADPQTHWTQEEIPHAQHLAHQLPLLRSNFGADQRAGRLAFKQRRLKRASPVQALADDRVPQRRARTRLRAPAMTSGSCQRVERCRPQRRCTACRVVFDETRASGDSRSTSRYREAGGDSRCRLTPLRTRATARCMLDPELGQYWGNFRVADPGPRSNAR